MAPRIPTSEPTVFSAGDTVSWTRSIPDFSPDDGWILSYAFRGERGDGRLDVTAGNNLDGSHSIAITPAQTKLMRPGMWVWAAYVSLGTDRYKVGQGTTRVEPNLAATNFSTDLRSPAKIKYDRAIELESQINANQTVMLNGRQATQHDLDKLKRWIDAAKSEYFAEVYAEANPGSGDNPRHIKVRLNRYDE